MIANNPIEILQTLDQKLDHDVNLILYGRAAISIGFHQSPPHFQSTQDVDAIISFAQLPELTNDEQFWRAIDETNDLLSPRGLYITHLFAEDQVFLRPDWAKHIVPISTIQTKFLKLFRPHCVDLILTKMMRGNDSLDMDDIAFLLTTEPISRSVIEHAFQVVRIPQDIPDFREAFQRALPAVRSIMDKMKI